MFSCSAQGWTIFSEPEKSTIDQLVLSIKQRIEVEEIHRSLNATEYEKSDKHFERFLKLHFLDADVALNRWHGWVEWRHENKIDEITDEEVKNELTEGIFGWRGKNKDGMLCCVITGRMLKPSERKGTLNSFKKYLIRFVEEGMRKADEVEQDKICIIYDRRGLEYENVDPNLYQFCKRTIDELKEWYGSRVGAVYVLHVNTMFWVLYMVIIMPLLSIFNSSHRLTIVSEPEELLEYFEENELQLLRVEPEEPLSS